MPKRTFLRRNLNFYVQKVVTGPFQENSYIIWDSSNRQAILIDPGDDCKLINDQIKLNKLTPIAIINTHAHLDHIGAVSDLKNLYDIPFYLHKNEMMILDSYEDSCEMFGISPNNKPSVNYWIKNEDKLSIGTFEIKIIHTPGHTPGGVCYEIEDHVFVGDTLFNGSVGRTDLPGGSWNTLKKSLMHLIDTVDHEKIIHSGHGNDTTLSFELHSNSYLISLN